ncbi:MAG: hypothetical protein D6723_02710 [Acidobacteria bacterium]|nr:MAG: hypothetical protein D6723_02710 [Acidobacteriota bacterium]
MTFEELVKKLQEIDPEEDDMDLIEASARRLWDEFGPRDVELFVEWMERAQATPELDRQRAIAEEILDRAQGERLKEVMRSFFDEDIVF